RVEEVRLLGRHNVANILAASLLARLMGASVEAIREVATSFKGVEHRLEFVREVRGVRYYNDSIATSPERVVAALNAFDDPIVLLAGGRDKHLPWEEMARLTVRKVRHLILFGEAVPIIRRAVEKAKAESGSEGPIISICTTLEEAVSEASRSARPGEVVLLSPGGTSFDAFRDYAHRGKRFKELVKQL
ncbi:MAG: UDP-N-acetylmuramoyl-L-alanine--D-glutamate ligase, partial [Chloroflexi bacterium]